MQERKCLEVKINKKSRPKMRKKNVWSKIVSRNSCVHVYAYPSWNEDQSGSEGITVLKNLSCLSSKWDPFLVTVTRGIPFCRVQVFIMAVRSRCSPANKYYRQANTNTCKYLTGLGVFFFNGKTPWGKRDGYSLHSWKPGSCYNSVFQRWNPPPNMSRNIKI